MRHKIGKKYLKIACSWILIFSICFLSWNTVPAFEEDTFISEEGTYEDSADDDQKKQLDDFIPDEEEPDQESENQGSEEQEPEDQIPDSLKVEELDAEIKKALANGEEPYTDRVEYIDETGTPIAGAPVTISLGKIEDHISLFCTDKNYEFKSARVDGVDTVFIGRYKDNLYYSTDGIDADRMEDRQKLVLTYAEIKDTQDNEDNSPEETPDQTPDQIPEEKPEETPDQIPEERPEETPNQTPEERPEETPDQTPEERPEETPDQTPEERPEETPNQTPEERPEETPDQIPEERPEETPDTEESEQVSVQELEEELQKDLANGEEPFTDRVEYIDETGELIYGAPEIISLGRIKDHVSLLISDKNYELKSARIDGIDCVFIGKYKGDLYYSTDGISADRMKDDQKLVMTYAEIKEAQDEEDSSDQMPDEEAPEQISVQSLDEELERSVETGNETSTGRVEYVDADGNSIAGAPATIDFGPIKDHSELSIAGKHFEFKNATVNGKKCVYIGKYRETIYYSMDGVVAIKLEDGQKLRMTYQEYYNITIKEIVPENGPLGTITQKNGDIDVPFDITKNVRVNAGKDWTISITPGPANNKKRYKIKDVMSQSGATITRRAGDDYGAIYNISFRKDDTIIITYDALGVYRVTINTRSNDGTEYINILHSKQNGYELDESGNLTWTYTEDNVNPVDGSIELPVFHTKRNYRLIHMVLNKQTVSAADSPREVPSGTGTNDAVKGHAGELIVNASMKDVPKAEREECQYEYSIKVQRQSGGWQDLNFDLAPYAIKEQALTVRMITNGRRSDEGLDVVMWDPDKRKLIPMHDNDTVNMDAIGSDTLLTQQTRQVRIFFAKPKSGYRFTNGGVDVGQPHSEDSPTSDGAISIARYGSISEMNANTMDQPRPFKIYQEIWSDAKRAAQSSGYTMYLSYGGAKAKNPPWILYAAYFSVASDSIYVHYNSGAGEGVLPADAVVKNIPYNEELDTIKNKPMQSYGENPNTHEGKRGMGSTFLLGEGCPEPTCEGYEFIGWKLRKKDFWQQQESFSDKLYKHNEVFKISEDNYDFARNQDLPVSVWDNEKGYQVVAQWKKIGMKNVEVEHYLKVPNDDPILEKTTDGTIVFADDQNQVIASGKPEPDGTFPGYVFDENDSRNKLEVIKNDSSTETITLKVYYKPTELMVSKAVTGYNLEPDRNYTFTIQANASMGTETGALVIENEQIYIKKKNENTVRNLTFTDNKATFTLKKDETVQIFCLSTGWNYTISETDPGRNYKTTYKINEGTVKVGRDASFDLTDASASVKFINVSTISPPETGRILQNNGYKILLMVVLAAGFACMVFFKKIKRNIRS